MSLVKNKKISFILFSHYFFYKVNFKKPDNEFGLIYLILFFLSQVNKVLEIFSDNGSG